MYNWAAPEDSVNVTSLVVTYRGGMLMMDFGFLNEMWLTIVRRRISVHATTHTGLPIVSQQQ